MSQEDRLSALAQAVGADIKALNNQSKILILGPNDPIPNGTPANTLIVRTTS